MQDYKNLSGQSNVSKYQIGLDFILVEFKTPSKSGFSLYKYSYLSAGQINVEQMKVLAVQGRGLQTFINTVVRELYESRS